MTKTLRDEIAIAAMEGLIADSDILIAVRDQAKDAKKSGEAMIAICAYTIADAMIAEKKRREEGE